MGAVFTADRKKILIGAGGYGGPDSGSPGHRAGSNEFGEIHTERHSIAAE